jgi:tubulin polyglutamylase TTLL6/13
MSKPYLIDGLKFDLRIYALLYGSDPMRVFVFQEGLARFATQEYEEPTKKNLKKLFMHLTNYAINKKSDGFVQNDDIDDDSGTKRTLSTILQYMKENEKGFDPDNFMRQIEDICVKACIAVQPSL